MDAYHGYRIHIRMFLDRVVLRVTGGRLHDRRVVRPVTIENLILVAEDVHRLVERELIHRGDIECEPKAGFLVLESLDALFEEYPGPKCKWGHPYNRTGLTRSTTTWHPRCNDKAP